MSEEFLILSEEELLKGVTKVNPVKPKKSPATSAASAERHTNQRREEPRRSGSRPTADRRREEPRRPSNRPTMDRRREDPRRSTSRPTADRSNSQRSSGDRRPSSRRSRKTKRSLLKSLFGVV